MKTDTFPGDQSWPTLFGGCEVVSRKGQHRLENWTLPLGPVGSKVRLQRHRRSADMPLPIPSKRALTIRTNPNHHVLTVEVL